MTNVDCHYYVEIFESEDDKDPIAISNIFKFPDDNPGSQIYADSMVKYVEGMSDGLDIQSVYYRIFRVRGDGVKKYVYDGVITPSEEEADSEDEEPEVDDADDAEPEEDDTAEESDDAEPEDTTEDAEPEEDDTAEESDDTTEDAEDTEPEDTTEESDDTTTEDTTSAEDTTEDTEDDWPWLTELEGEPAPKKNANKFMLGAIMNYWMRPEVSWDNAEKLSEEILEDPDDLWGVIANKSVADITEIFTGPPTLHRFLKMMPGHVHEIATNMVEKFDGDSRKIWEDQNVGNILQRLDDVSVKKPTASLIVWALRESGQLRDKD